MNNENNPLPQKGQNTMGQGRNNRQRNGRCKGMGNGMGNGMTSGAGSGMGKGMGKGLGQCDGTGRRTGQCRLLNTNQTPPAGQQGGRGRQQQGTGANNTPVCPTTLKE